MIVQCKCGNEFKTTEKRLASGRGKFCSRECKYKYRIRPTGLKYNLVKENPTSFKGGHSPWNKGTKGLVKSNSGSIKTGQRLSPETEFKKGQIPLNWKGNKVGYHALHAWVRRHKGKANKCIKCGANDNVQWANISREYKRELNDYMELCGKCHRHYDKDKLGIATKKFNLKHRKCRNKKQPSF